MQYKYNDSCSKQDIKISVIIPVYNVQHVLVRCLEHVVHNTYKNIEIIIVDDGSTDKTAEIYSRYKKQDKRIKVVKQKNAGPATARNTGLKIATGDYVHFCDSDDYVNLDYYERMAESASITNADIICGDVREKEFNFPQFHEVNIYTDLQDKISVIRAYNFSVVWRFLYKRKFLKDNNIWFPAGMYIGEDSVFMDYSLYHSYTLATADSAVYNCIDNPTSLGKNVKKISQVNPNGFTEELKKYSNFLRDTHFAELKDNIKKYGKFDSMTRFYFIKLCLCRVIRFVDNSKKWFLFGIPVLQKKVTQRRIKYYLFGIHLWNIK